MIAKHNVSDVATDAGFQGAASGIDGWAPTRMDDSARVVEGHRRPGAERFYMCLTIFLLAIDECFAAGDSNPQVKSVAVVAPAVFPRMRFGVSDAAIA